MVNVNVAAFGKSVCICTVLYVDISLAILSSPRYPQYLTLGTIALELP